MLSFLKLRNKTCDLMYYVYLLCTFILIKNYSRAGFYITGEAHVAPPPLCGELLKCPFFVSCNPFLLSE